MSKKSMKYRWRGDDLLIKRREGGTAFKIRNAKNAWHEGDDVMVISSLDHKIRIDPFGIKHW